MFCLCLLMVLSLAQLGGRGRSSPWRSILGEQNWGQNVISADTNINYLQSVKFQRLLPSCEVSSRSAGLATRAVTNLSDVSSRSFYLHQSWPAWGLTQICVTMLTLSQDWKRSDFALILYLRHNRTGIPRSQCIQYATSQGCQIGHFMANFKQIGHFWSAFTMKKTFGHFFSLPLWNEIFVKSFSFLYFLDGFLITAAVMPWHFSLLYCFEVCDND